MVRISYTKATFDCKFLNVNISPSVDLKLHNILYEIGIFKNICRNAKFKYLQLDLKQG